MSEKEFGKKFTNESDCQKFWVIILVRPANTPHDSFRTCGSQPIADFLLAELRVAFIVEKTAWSSDDLLPEL